MGSLQRSTERLGALRQRHMLGGASPLLNPQQFGRDRIPMSVVVLMVGATGFVLAMLAAMAVDTIVSGIRAIPTVLTTLEVMKFGSVGAAVTLSWMAIQGLVQRRALAHTPAPKRLAAAVQEELQLSNKRRGV